MGRGGAGGAAKAKGQKASLGGAKSRKAAEEKVAASKEVDSKTFAERAEAAAERSAAQRPAFGDKVFIHDAHREYVKEHGPISLNKFKAKLVEANNARHLDLSRADLVEAMSKHDVATSETSHLNATFNFIRLPRRPR